MRKILISIAFLALTAGCNVVVHEGDAHDDWDEDNSPNDICDPYCLELIECGVLSDTAFRGCRDICVEKFHENEHEVEEGSACVLDARCDAVEANACEGAPLPGVFPGGSAEESFGGAGGS